MGGKDEGMLRGRGEEKEKRRREGKNRGDVSLIVVVWGFKATSFHSRMCEGLAHRRVADTGEGRARDFVIRSRGWGLTKTNHHQRKNRHQTMVKDQRRATAEREDSMVVENLYA